MIYRVFILTMPNRASWNGKWTGDNRLFCIVKRYKNNDSAFINVDKSDSHYYNFEDGWGASIQIRKIDREECAIYKRRSNGFQGYDWMIDEIEKYGRILTRNERKEQNNDGLQKS